MTKRSRVNWVNNNTLAVVAIILIVVNAVIFTLSSKDMFSGKATDQGRVQICIGTPPTIGQVATDLPPVLNGTINVTVNAQNASKVDFFLKRFGQSRVSLGRDTDPDEDDTYNVTFDTTTVPDGNCLNRFVAIASDVCGLPAQDASSTYSIDNDYQAPIWDEFENEQSTNFTAAGPPYSKIQDANITNPDWGTIYFTGVSNFDNVNLSAIFNISNNTILYDIDQWCFLNAYYTIEFRNITYVDPLVLKDGSPCRDQCLNYQLGTDSIKFITQLSYEGNLTLTEGTNVTLNLTLNPDGQDVDLNWSYTLNNPYSTPPDSYNIYYSDNASAMLNLTTFGSPNVSGITDTHWTDTTANDSSQRYYVLTAVKNGREARAIQTGCKFDINMYPGQNLFSLPCNINETSIDNNVIPPQTSLYDRIVRYVPGTGFQRTDYYGPEWKWWGFYEELEPDTGYYAYPTKAEYTIVSVGTIPEQNRTVNVSEGVNVLGWTSVFTKEISNVLMPSEAHWYDTITRYNKSTSWERADYYGTTWGWWGTFTSFGPGRGYWYYPVAENYTWEYSPLP